MLDIHKKNSGNQAEQKACDFLQTKGLQLVTRNYRSPYGEIDLIMRDSNDVVFIEVRSRKQSRYGSSIESVDTQKQNKLIKTAIHYLQAQRLLDKVDCRFDIIGIEHTETKPTIEWIKDAFSTEIFLP